MEYGIWIWVRLVRDRWVTQLQERLRKAEVTVYFLSKYVDDANVAVAIIHEGWS